MKDAHGGFTSFNYCQRWRLSCNQAADGHFDKQPAFGLIIIKKHYSLDQVQMMTDHARRESVKRYASVQLEEKRRLLEGNVVDMKRKSNSGD